MCNSINCSHTDNLDDDLDGLFDGPAQPLVIAPVDITPKGELVNAPMRATVETRAAAAGHRYEEQCDKCRGTGRFVGYTGRVLGNCFECKGKGIKVFKSSPEARAKAADARDRSKARTAATILDQRTAWAEANPAEWAWLLNGVARGFEFAVSLHGALLKYGHFTEKQEAAIKRMTVQSAERQAAWKAEREARESAKAEIAIDRVAEAFVTAKANKLKYPKLRLAGFTFSPAGENSRNPGSIYIKEGETYLGKITDGRFSRSRDCTAELEQAILAAAADPEAAASAYGLQTGICSCCGRELTAKESVGLGIGPVCRKKYGW